MQLAGRSATMLALAWFLAVALVPSNARASWPMARHDAKRVGSATGTADLTSPIPYWRTYLGGAIGATQLLEADANGDGKQDFLLASGGEVIAKDTTDAVLWKTSALGINSFAGIGDLDGDGIPDVVTFSGNHVIVLSLRTGAVEWTEPDGEMGSIGGVRVGDVTGDGKPDVLAVECGCCGVNSGNSGFFWTFGAGFANAMNLGALSVFACGTVESVTLLQADTSAKLETLLADESHFALLGDNGGVLAQTGMLGTNTAENACTTANIDGVPGDEAVCFLNSSDAPATNQRRITVLHYDYTAQPATLDVVWSKVVAPDAGGDMHWVDPLIDLDGDGSYEIVASTNDPTNGWQTHVYDALTGTELVPAIAGQTVAGTVAMEDKAKRVLLTASGTAVTAWVFARVPSATVTMRWIIPSAAVLVYPDVARLPLESIWSDVVATDLNGDGLDDAILQSLTTGASSGVVGYSGAGGSAQQVASLALPSDVDLLTTWVVPPMSIATPQVALARSDGVLQLLDGHLQTTTAGSPSAEIDVHLGGYYASGAWRELYHAPRLVALDASKSEAVLVDDSREALLRLDASAASWAVVPTRVWQVTHTYAPAVVAGLDGSNTAMACLALTEPVTNPPIYRVRAVRTDGTLKWDQPLTGVPLNDLVPGNFDGDMVPDFALQLGDSGDANLVTLAIAGATGSPLWTTQPLFPGPGGVESAGVSVGDWNADTFDDVYFQGGATRVLSGKDGSQLVSGGTSDAYALPVLYDTDADGQDEVTVSADFSPVTLYSHDLETALWTSPDADHPYPYGAMAACGGTAGTPVLVEGSWQNPARLKLTAMAGSSLGAFTTVVLADGALYPNEAAATAAKAFLGQLTAANVHTNLTGKGRPTAVVGSADGWLYGVNPCDGTLDFSVNLGAAVGEAVFGDTDGDGRDEILVTAADGYLYDLKNDAIAEPGYVWDTDPDHGITDHDIDDITTTNKLSAVWAAVNGATGYAVEVVTTDGKLVSSPAWQTVGTATSTSLTGLPLTDGTKYIFAVRALSTTGPSVDAVSNGVIVHFPSGADAGIEGGLREAGIEGGAGEDGGSGNQETGGTPGGCGCRTARSPSDDAWLVALITVPFALVAGRRRLSRRP